MKILYLITKSNWGGAQKYVFDLALAMKEKGEEVTVAFGGNGILMDKLKDKNIKIIKINNLERDINILKEWQVMRDLYKIFKKEKPDLIHLNSSKIGLIGSVVAKITGIKKIIFTAHGWAFREERGVLQTVLIALFSWLTVVFSDMTICVSQKDFDDIKDSPFVKDKIITIHNGILSNLEDLQIGERSINENSKIKIISIGELHKNKGFIYGLETINLLRERLKDFKYDIYSFGGDEKEELENKIRELNLQDFAEIHINNEKHTDYLSAADIYFMPSIKEGLPYILLEAGLNSLSIVASDTGGINEIIENYKNGFLIKPKDINGFELALEKLISDIKLRQDFGKNIKEKIIKDFDIHKMIKETEDIYYKD